MENIKENTKPDTLTQRIGVLTRREVEARILIPVIDALGKSFARNEHIQGLIVQSGQGAWCPECTLKHISGHHDFHGDAP